MENVNNIYLLRELAGKKIRNINHDREYSLDSVMRDGTIFAKPWGATEFVGRDIVKIPYYQYGNWQIIEDHMTIEEWLLYQLAI